jgi:dihydropteroate synthase
MGILNVTPDSFSDGGQLQDINAVLGRAGEMVNGGADVLDIGGESTRPGGSPVGEGEELARVLPAVRAVRARWPDIPISIDTFKPRVAEAAVHAGADIVNDVWGFLHGIDSETRSTAIAALRSVPVGGLATKPQLQPPLTLPRSAMAATVARLHCPAIVMHNRPDQAYADFWTDLIADLRLSIAVAQAAGVPNNQLWLDPGFGFAKTPAQNLDVIKHLERIVALGFPVLVGTSRKSTLGKVLGTTVDDRVEGTGATAVWSIERGCRMIRVHEVAVMKRFARMADAINAGLDAKLAD